MAEEDPEDLRLVAAKALNDALISQSEANSGQAADLVTVARFDASSTVLYPLGDPSGANSKIDRCQARSIVRSRLVPRRQSAQREHLTRLGFSSSATPQSELEDRGNSKPVKGEAETHLEFFVAATPSELAKLDPDCVSNIRPYEGNLIRLNRDSHHFRPNTAIYSFFLTAETISLAMAFAARFRNHPCEMKLGPHQTGPPENGHRQTILTDQPYNHNFGLESFLQSDSCFDPTYFISDVDVQDMADP